ncbi:MAG TPA: glycosyltransferase family 2 protein [Cyanobacteria bacterium UBA8530]|nr:glycosyltransferase family 2 protein [Cyanobacteria bacterium UBA8530]
MKKNLAIALVNWNAKEYLDACLSSIERETKISHEIWVVDNASTDGSKEYLRDRRDVRLIANEGNEGFAKANNQVMRLADASYFLLLNPDTVILDQALDRMVAYLESHPEAGAVGCKLLNPDLSLQPSCHAFYSTLGSLIENKLLTRLISWRSPRSPWLSFWDHERIRSVDWVTGACLMVRKETIEQVGELDERFFMYGEEVDWQKRMREKGLQVHFLPEARIIHYGGGCSKKAKKPMNRQELLSRELFIEKHYPFSTLFLYRLKARIARLVMKRIKL